MSKLIGIQAEVNLTLNDDLMKSVGKGIEKGAIHIEDIFKELKAPIIETIKKELKKGDK